MQASPPADRKALVFGVAGVRFALRLSVVREIVAVGGGGGEVLARGARVPSLDVAVTLGLPASTTGFAVVTEGPHPVALRVERVHGVVDLSAAEVYQLPSRTLLPQPPPFAGAVVDRGELALELAVGALGWAPLAPAPEIPGPPPGLDFPTGRELLFTRRGRSYAVPLELLGQVLEAPRVHPVPLTPSAHRGLLVHGRAVHPAFDVAVLYGDGADPAGAPPRHALLVDAGGESIAVLADRVLPSDGGAGADVARPSWDALLGA